VWLVYVDVETGSFKTLVHIYQGTWCHIPAGCYIHSHCQETIIISDDLTVHILTYFKMIVKF